MIQSTWNTHIQDVLESAKQRIARRMRVDNQRNEMDVPPPFPSPEDWRDQWMYFLMLDRFNNPLDPPHHLPYDSIFVGFQGGTFNGVRSALPYLKELGVGAIWLSPVLKNCQYREGSYHGYGIQDFLSIEPRFASSPSVAEQELRMLIDAAHALNMYIIFDIVLNHTGDVFAYQCHPSDGSCLSVNDPQYAGSQAEHSDTSYPILWRDKDGTPRKDWPVAEDIANPPLDAVVWPAELRYNASFRRQGLPQVNGDQTIGDFASLKQLLTGNPDVQRSLIRAYQYLIAKFDIDGFRIDTLKYIDRGFARLFGNEIREYALSIGKKNFFTFGEVYDSEEKIAAFIGRNTMDSEADDFIGVDAALDFPLFYKLPLVCKGMLAPGELVGMYEYRRQVERDILSSHGDASNFFVTFLDNHDQVRRFHYSPADDPHRYDDQLTLGVACLFALQGIPCLYYGTEQGLHGNGDIFSGEAVREALWGKPDAFDTTAPFYTVVKTLAHLRAQQPALRYGHQYFRPISGDFSIFRVSTFAPGILAFSRILSYQEVIVVANTDTQNTYTLGVIVDETLNAVGTAYQVHYSNKPTFISPGPVTASSPETVTYQVDGAVSYGPARYITVTLQPMEVQILGKKN
jgi:glycosidase